MEAKTKAYLLPHIVEITMKYLSIRDLRTWQKVCLLWNDFATREICRRQYFVPFSHGPYCLVHHISHPNYEKCKYTFPLNLSDNALNEYMKGMSAVSAQMCITFVSKAYAMWYDTDAIPYEDRRYGPLALLETKMLIQNCLMRHLSRETIPHFFLTNGIVFWTNDGVPVEAEQTFGMSGVLIPDDPELKIYSCGPEDIYESKQDNLDKCSLLKRIPKDVNIKCLLLFAERSDLFCKYINFVEACQDRQSTVIAVGGLCLPSRLLEHLDSEISDSFQRLDLFFNTDSDAEINRFRKGKCKGEFHVDTCRVTNFVCYSGTDSKIDSEKESDATMERDSSAYNDQVIAFCGERLEAASVTINSSDSKESIVRNLRKFQDIVLGKKKCLAFIFRNSSHVSRNYKGCDYESSIFHRLFPDVPLIGAFGKGIIGTNTVPRVAVKSLDIPNNSMEKPYDTLCEHKTVFVFIAMSMPMQCGDFR